MIGCDKYPPYNFEDKNGQPTGIDVDLAREAFDRLGYKPVFVTINWEDKTDLLDSGEIAHCRFRKCIYRLFYLAEKRIYQLLILKRDKFPQLRKSFLALIEKHILGLCGRLNSKSSVSKIGKGINIAVLTDCHHLPAVQIRYRPVVDRKSVV